MKMTRYYEMIKKLEDYAQQKPRMYQFKVKLLISLGYLYLFALFAIAIGLGAFVVYGYATGEMNGFGGVYYLILMVAFLYGIITSLYLKIDPPSALELHTSEHPELFALIEEVREQMKAPKLQAVLINHELNAGIYQIPRFGLFGGHQNYLILGLPMMQALTKEEFKAVIAHEMGHLSAGHGRTASFALRLLDSLERLYDQAEEKKGYTRVLFTVFFRWYNPYFYAYTVVLQRQQEFKADEASVSLTSLETTTQALVRFPLIAKLYDAYIETINKEKMLKTFFDETKKVLSASVKDKQAWLDEELTVKTQVEDTHPSLTDRLAHIGATPSLPMDMNDSSDLLLGEGLNNLVLYMNSVMYEHHVSYEEYESELSVESEKKLKEIDEIKTPSMDDEMARVQIALEGDGPKAALKILDEIQARRGSSPRITYNIGMMKLHLGDEEGVKLIESAMRDRRKFRENGTASIFQFYKAMHEPQKADRYLELYMQEEKNAKKVEKERNQVDKNTVYLLSELTQNVKEQMKASLSEVSWLEKLYLSRRVVKLHPEDIVYVAAYVGKHADIEQIQILLDRCLQNDDIDIRFVECKENDNMLKKMEQVY
jgi:Zn-dependent protease with chaperone function